MATISLHKFYFDAIVRARETKERYGQAMFNHLMVVRPELATKIQETPCDPFHVTRLNCPAWDNFVAFIEAEWYNNYQWSRCREVGSND